MAGPITTLTATTNALLSWTASETNSAGQLVSGSLSLGVGGVMTTGSVGILPACNQVMQIPTTIPPGSSATIDLSITRANVTGNTQATLARSLSCSIWLPTVAQANAAGNPAGVAGCLASSITVGKGSPSPVGIFGLDSNSRLLINLGEQKWSFTSQGGGDLINGSSKNLLIVNNDAVNAATVLLTLFGNDT